MNNPASRPPFGRRLRTPAAAEYIGIAASTLEKMRVSGTGPEFERVGKKAIVYSVDALETYLAQRRARSTSETDTPTSSPTAVSSFARLTPSCRAVVPYHLSIR